MGCEWEKPAEPGSGFDKLATAPSTGGHSVLGITVGDSGTSRVCNLRDGAPGTHSQVAATVGFIKPDWSLLSLAPGGSGVSHEGRLRLGPVCCLSENSLKSAGPSSLCV